MGDVIFTTRGRRKKNYGSEGRQAVHARPSGKVGWRQGRASGCAEGKGSGLYVNTAVEIILALRLTSTF